MNRKTFLTQLSYAGVGVSTLGLVSCKNTPPQKVAEAPSLFFKLSLAQWSINRAIREQGVSPYDFAKLAKGWGFEGLEYVSQLYTDVTQSDAPEAAMQNFIDRSNEEAAKYGLQNLLIMIDGEGELSSSDEDKRNQAIENHKKWIEAAHAMNCHSVRINLFGESDPELWKQNSITSLQALSAFGKPLNVNVIVENHGSFTSNAALLMEAINGAEMDNCGTLPDFGNFCVKRSSGGPWGGSCEEEYDRYIGTEEMMPKAFGVSAKSHDFDADGNETHTDFKRMLTIVKEAGYSGFIGVEYEGSELSEEAGILATRDLLLKVGAEI